MTIHTLENLIHQSLEGRWCILNSKEHHGELIVNEVVCKQAPIGAVACHLYGGQVLGLSEVNQQLIVSGGECSSYFVTLFRTQ